MVEILLQARPTHRSVREHAEHLRVLQRNAVGAPTIESLVKGFLNACSSQQPSVMSGSCSNWMYMLGRC